MIVVTGNYSKWKLGDTFPLTAYREWTVTGVSTEAAALAAVDAVAPTPPGGTVAQRGATHEFAPTKLFCTGPFVVERSKGGHVWTIGANFVQPNNGSLPDNPNDPLLKKARIRWNPVTISEEVDLDLDGRPIVGPNGEPIGGITREVTYYELYLTRYFPSWNTSLNATYVNATNSASVSLIGGPTVAIQNMRCTGFAPTNEYDTDEVALRIQMTAKFDIFFDTSLGTYPFQSRVMAQGSYGFSTDNKGPFVGPSGKPLNGPVKLAADGKPMNVDGNSLLKIELANSTLATPTANPGTGWVAATPAGSGTGSTVLALETLTYSIIGYFKKTRVVNLLPFLSLF